MGSIGSFKDVLGMVKRRRWLIGTTAAIGIGASLQFALNQPHTYAASALIQIESPRSFTDNPRGSAVIPGEYWLQIVQARLMVRDNIVALIDQFDLFEGQEVLDESLKVEIIRRSLRIDSMTGTGTQFYGNTAALPGVLQVTATMPTPQLAAAVANELAQDVLELNSSTQSERAQETMEFYTREEARIAQRIETVEDEMAAFRNENLEILPTTLDNRLEELRLIEGELTEIEGELLGAQSKLAEMDARGSLSTVERRELDKLEREATLLATRQSQLKDRMSNIRASGRRSVNAEAQMESYDRRLTQLRSQLSEMTGRRAAAETAQRLNVEQQGDQFVLLERAVEPAWPEKSSRRKILVFGVAASIMLGLILALILEMLKPVLRSAGQMERATGLRPVMTLPDVKTDKHGR